MHIVTSGKGCAETDSTWRVAVNATFTRVLDAHLSLLVRIEVKRTTMGQ
jgi:hypothetical protein